MPKPHGPESGARAPEALKNDPDAGLKNAVDSIKKSPDPEKAKVDLQREQSNLRTLLEQKVRSSADEGPRKAARKRLAVIEVQLMALDKPNLSTKQVVEQYKKIVKKRQDTAKKMLGIG